MPPIRKTQRKTGVKAPKSLNAISQRKFGSEVKKHIKKAQTVRKLRRGVSILRRSDIGSYDNKKLASLKYVIDEAKAKALQRESPKEYIGRLVGSKIGREVPIEKDDKNT